MADRDLAARILQQITDYPEQHDQAQWLEGIDRLSPDQPLPCGTTLCVAGHAAHLRGYTLSNELRGTLALKEGAETLPVEAVARRELGLTSRDAAHLFNPVLEPPEVRAALRQLADGADTVNWAAVHASD
ncbi:MULTISPECIES: hypothetical protein [unclassified Streptomyces]|uniref:hypothetical protein n=1 Tax=unclassified Streptomyces TaxID=2593676 RepID=UPI003D8BAE88